MKVSPTFYGDFMTYHRHFTAKKHRPRWFLAKACCACCSNLRLRLRLTTFSETVVWLSIVPTICPKIESVVLIGETSSDGNLKFSRSIIIIEWWSVIGDNYLFNVFTDLLLKYFYFKNVFDKSGDLNKIVSYSIWTQTAIFPFADHNTTNLRKRDFKNISL